MIIVTVIISILVVLAVMFAWIFACWEKVKDEYESSMIIIEAISQYHLHCIELLGNGTYNLITYNIEKNKVKYDDMKSIEYLTWRFWDWKWGPEDILPPDKYELVKPFIEIDEKEKKDGTR